LRKLTPKNHGLEVEEKQEKQKQNIDLSMTTNDNHSKNHKKNAISLRYIVKL
jgi:dihydroneopterin aldolase